jgi:DNA-binding GntR family transcriptional regulator
MAGEVQVSIESERTSSGRVCRRLLAEAPGLFHADPRATRVEIVGSQIGPLGATEAGHLRRVTGTLAWHVRRRWYREDEVVLGEVDTIPLAAHADVPAHLDSLPDLVRAMGGQPVHWEEVALDVVAAQPWSAELCAVDRWTPLLSVKLTGVAGSGRALYHAVQLHPPGTFQATILFSRTGH